MALARATKTVKDSMPAVARSSDRPATVSTIQTSAVNQAREIIAASGDAAAAMSDEDDDSEGQDEYVDIEGNKLVHGVIRTKSERQLFQQQATLSSFLTNSSTAQDNQDQATTPEFRTAFEEEGGDSDASASSLGHADTVYSSDSLDELQMSISGRRNDDGGFTESSGVDGLLSEDESEESESDEDSVEDDTAAAAAGSARGPMRSDTGRGSDGESSVGSGDEAGDERDEEGEADIENSDRSARKKRKFQAFGQYVNPPRQRRGWSEKERKSHQPSPGIRPSWKLRDEKRREEREARSLMAQQANSKLCGVLSAITDSNWEPLKALVADPTKTEKHLVGYLVRARVLLLYTTLLLDGVTRSKRVLNKEVVERAAMMGFSVSAWQVPRWYRDFIRSVPTALLPSPVATVAPSSPPLLPRNSVLLFDIRQHNSPSITTSIAAAAAPVTLPAAPAVVVLGPAFNFSPLHPYVWKTPLPIKYNEDMRNAARFWVRTHANVKGKPVMKAMDFKRWCNSVLIPKFAPSHSPISKRTAHRWLGLLGFKKLVHKKGMYVDGHERGDVIEDRGRYVVEMKGHQRYMHKYSGNNMDVVTEPEMLYADGKRLVLVVHDETTFHQNDGARWSYREGGVENMPLMQKSMGAAVHVSGFLSEECGLLVVTEGELDAYYLGLDAGVAVRAAAGTQVGAGFETDVRGTEAADEVVRLLAAKARGLRVELGYFGDGGAGDEAAEQSVSISLSNYAAALQDTAKGEVMVTSVVECCVEEAHRPWVPPQGEALAFIEKARRFSVAMGRAKDLAACASARLAGLRAGLGGTKKHLADARHETIASKLHANVKIKIGAAHKTQWHPSGYWCGDDVLFQLEHAITLFEVKHPGCKGLWLFDNSTGHNKMASDALLTSRMNLEPGGQFPSQLRTTTYKGVDGSNVEQSFVFKEGEVLRVNCTVNANPFGVDGLVVFNEGAVVEAKRPGGSRAWEKGCEVVSQQPDGTYSIKFGSTSVGGVAGGDGVGEGGVGEGRGEGVVGRGGEIVSGVPVHFIQVPSKKFKSGVAHAELVGHSKGIKQILLERDLIDDQQAKTTKKNGQKGVCKSVSRKERAEQAEGGEGELGVGESVELPRHMGAGGGKQWCCLEWLLSEQDDFKKQENAVREYIKSRGHVCIFLPKFHPGILLTPPLVSPLLFFNFLEEPCLTSPHIAFFLSQS